ncbi:venom allergen 5 isoform X1 [Bactrocera oleae]|uniref:venom allergen 5 isoform X1 n=2 Tax=Bactrocera oleae TaxID=104688 RepID=UPI00387EAD8C
MLFYFWFQFGLIEAASSIFDKTIPTVSCQNNITCGYGVPHIMCVSRPPQCQPFTPLKLGADDIYQFLLGHNGLRNRVAKQYNIANMNIVHWSDLLQIRAERFLRRCRVEPDSCQKVGPRETQVNQNFHFHHGVIHRQWAAHLVRKWYNEFNYREKWENFKEKRKSGLIGNYSQMIYPSVEQIGCNAANLSDGTLFVCYYWPRTLKKYEAGFLYGEPCSQCNPQLPACSRIFRGLCGIDLEISEAVSLLKSVEQQVILNLVLIIFILRCIS